MSAAYSLIHDCARLLLLGLVIGYAVGVVSLHVGEEVWDFQDGSAACALCSLMIGRSFDLTIAFGVNIACIFLLLSSGFHTFHFLFLFFFSDG